MQNKNNSYNYKEDMSVCYQGGWDVINTHFSALVKHCTAFNVPLACTDMINYMIKKV